MMAPKFFLDTDSHGNITILRMCAIFMTSVTWKVILPVVGVGCQNARKVKPAGVISTAGAFD